MVDKSTPDHDLTWSTPATALVAVLIGGLVLLAAAVGVDNEPAGQLLIGLAAVGLLVIAAFGFRQRPRLAIRPGPPAELVVRRLSGTYSYRAESIDRARVVRYPRLGRRVPMLELEVFPESGAAATNGPDDSPQTRLLMFSRWDVGAAPEDVLDALYQHGLARTE